MSTDFIGYAAADNYRLARSKSLVTPADDTYNLIRIPKFSFISSVWLFISSAYSLSTATLTVGWAGNGETAQPAGFMSSDISKPNEVGLKKAMRDTLVAYEGKYFSDAGGMITLTTDDNGGTAGTCMILVQYCVLH